MRTVVALGLCAVVAACASTGGRSARFDNGTERPAAPDDGAERWLAEVLQMVMQRPQN